MTSLQPVMTSSLALFLILLHPAQLISYNNIIKEDSPNVLSWHRLPECPSDEDHFRYDLLHDQANCQKGNTLKGNILSCAQFEQLCYNGTMKISCSQYRRICEDEYCSESYDDCTVQVNVTDPSLLVMKAPGVPAKLFTECIPAVDALRDQCNSTFSCETEYRYDSVTDELLECSINCPGRDKQNKADDESEIKMAMQCFNYTRDCSVEVSSVVNTTLHKTVKIEESDCEVITSERRLDEYLVWNGTIIGYDEQIGEPLKEGSQLLNRTVYMEWGIDESWEECTVNTMVPYEPICNQFISHIMEPLRDVIYEPKSHDLLEGIKTFLDLWDDGYKILCNVKYDCFVKLIKYSRVCWRGLPLERFLSGADYASLEDLMKNMMKLACRTTPTPAVKYEGNDTHLNNRISCSVFFTEDHGVTEPFATAVYGNCTEGPGICTDGCNQALKELSDRFGCCLGSIMYEYTLNYDWYRLLNFGDNGLIRTLNACNTTLHERCEMIDRTSIVVTIVKNFVFIVSGLMALVVIIMIVSFYWQLEHEPIKKQFYHF